MVCPLQEVGLVQATIFPTFCKLDRSSFISSPTEYHILTSRRFTDSVVTNSTNGLRIKTDFNATGSVVNVTYSNIALSNIKEFGIVVEQDYLNGGPSGTPTDGVLVENIHFENVAGWAVPAASDYYVLCGQGSCEGISYKNVHITGGKALSSCNYPWSGCPGP